MLESALLLLGSVLLMLRVSPNGSFPPMLSAEDERKCIEEMLQGDIGARNTLIEHNLRLVAHIIKKYYTNSTDIDDLISIGTVGLIKGIDSYRPEKGVRLATYASRCCENEILMYFRSQKKSAGDVSLSDILEADSDGKGLSLMDIVSEDEELSDQIGDKELCKQLRESIDSVLTERERRIILLRYGLMSAEPLTQNETAKLCGISRSYVSRIEKRALEKLRDALGEAY